MLLKPREEKPIAISLSSIAGIANVKENIFPFCEKLINNDKYGLFHFGVMGRGHSVYLIYDKLICFTSSERNIFFKRSRVMDAPLCLKDVVSFGREHNIIRCSLIDFFEGQMIHSDTIVPVIPLRPHSSAMRFSALRLTSSECFHRSRASSYDYFGLFEFVCSYSWGLLSLNISISASKKDRISSSRGLER